MSLFDRFLSQEKRAAKAEKLWAEGLEELEFGLAERARRTARKLERLKFSGWFELDGRALAKLDRHEEALSVLRRGVELCPSVGRLWYELGIVLSDVDRFAEAHEAFARARGCAGMDAAEIAFNDALVWHRESRDDRAEAELASIVTSSSAPLAFCIAGLRADCMLGRGAAREALDAIDRALSADVSSVTDRQGIAAHARVWTTRARVRRALGVASELVRSDVERALEIHRVTPDAPRLLRELDGLRSASARCWRLMVEGEKRFDPVEGEPDALTGTHRFLTTYLVVADTPEHALTFCTPFERDLEPSTIIVHESEDLGDASDELLGVVQPPMGRTFYPVEDARG